MSRNTYTGITELAINQKEKLAEKDIGSYLVNPTYPEWVTSPIKMNKIRTKLFLSKPNRPNPQVPRSKNRTIDSKISMIKGLFVKRDQNLGTKLVLNPIIKRPREWCAEY